MIGFMSLLGHLDQGPRNWRVLWWWFISCQFCYYRVYSSVGCVCVGGWKVFLHQHEVDITRHVSHFKIITLPKWEVLFSSKGKHSCSLKYIGITAHVAVL